MKRVIAFGYGLVCYAMFLAIFIYALGFVGNVGVPRSLDAAPTDPFWFALLVNTLLLGVFAVQHSVMARPTFKRWWTRFVPEPVERSTYVLFSNLAMALMFWQWRPMGGVIWNVENAAGRVALQSVCAAGFLLVLVTTFLINHFDLFGLRQVWFYLLGREYKSLRFVTPGPYKLVRHPLYVGWLMAFWGAPTMTAAHMLFAVMTTAYILVAIRLEERNLMEHHGATYKDYCERVPMLIPGKSREIKPALAAVAVKAD